MSDKTYLCIDLKSFYASVECIERGLDPLDVNLVVADDSRTEKTICLAVTPALKEYGVSGRARLFEVVQTINQINSKRKISAPENKFTGESCFKSELNANPSLKISYIISPPRMAHYIEYSTKIYNIYLEFIAPEDIHVYSIDEVFIDITAYIKRYKKNAVELAKMIIKTVHEKTGITATAGIGTNMYLAKIAMDIEAKHTLPDKDGVRIAELDELTYRKKLWEYRPLTDFWRVGPGYAKKLEENRIYTMGDIALASTTQYGENRLYKLFGINAELLIDHAWGYEPCTIADIKGYVPENKSICSGQVLQRPYSFDEAKLVVREMLELLSLDLVEKCLVTDQIVLTVGYDVENLKANKKKAYKGTVKSDHYGRKIPKNAHGTANIGKPTSSSLLITRSTLELFDKIVDKNLSVRRIYISANHILSEKNILNTANVQQVGMFDDFEEQQNFKKERAIQKATVNLKKQYGKNAVLKGFNLHDEATTIDRNSQIGGHRA